MQPPVMKIAMKIRNPCVEPSCCIEELIVRMSTGSNAKGVINGTTFTAYQRRVIKLTPKTSCVMIV